MAGYFNYSKSNNAVYAESQGRYPATKCAQVYGFKSAKLVRETMRSTEWHHTSKKYNITDFYDWPGHLENCELSDLAGLWRKLKRDSVGQNMIKERVKEIISSNLFDDRFHLIALRRKSGFYLNRKRDIEQ